MAKNCGSIIVREVARAWMLVRDTPKGPEVMYRWPSRSASAAWENHFGFNRSYRPDDFDRRKKDMKATGWRACLVVIGQLK